jgi:small-conductance mechanosensitive channel
MEPEGVVIQLPADASPELIERLSEAFPDAQLVPPEPAPALDVIEREVFDEAVTDAVLAAPGLPERLADWWAALPFGGWGAIAIVLGALLAGWVVERGAALLIREAAASTESGPLARRFGLALRWSVRRLFLIGVFSVAAVIAFRAVAPTQALLAQYAREILTVVAFNRVIYVVLAALTAPGDQSRRLLALDDAGARRVNHAAFWTIAGLSIVGALRATLDAAAGLAPETVLARLGLIVLAALVGAGFFLRCARPVRELLTRQFGADPDELPSWKRVLAARWFLVYLALLLIDMALKAAGVLGLLGPSAQNGAGAAVTILVMAPLAVAGLRVWRAETADAAEAAGRVKGGAFLGFVALAEGAIIVLAGALILRAWGIDPFAANAESGLGRAAARLVIAAVILVAGFALWRAVAALMAVAQTGPDDPALPEEERQSRQRMGTILPVLRGFVLAVIGVMTVMTALSSIGVNIAPLIASAGVVGLAIGFGAQRLVSDVISGLLYLYEDAFRIGEYIEVQGGKGKVERISIRSVRLRHPRGPVYTIPFSAMGTVQNHSRDYATMKFTFMVPSSTDLEKVRKLVKKAGEKMLQDPEVAHMILEPLKSQGAIAITGPAYTIGIKFTAKPGEQFMVRRKAFIAISEAFAANGIELYTPQLTLNPNDPADLKPMNPDGTIPAPQAAQ